MPCPVKCCHGPRHLRETQKQSQRAPSDLDSSKEPHYDPIARGTDTKHYAVNCKMPLACPCSCPEEIDFDLTRIKNVLKELKRARSNKATRNLRKDRARPSLKDA